MFACHASRLHAFIPRATSRLPLTHRRVHILRAVLHCSGNLAGDTGGGAVFAEMGSNATFTNCLAVNNTLFAAGKARAGYAHTCARVHDACVLRVRSTVHHVAAQ